MADGDVQRDLGRMEAQIDNLTKSVEAMAVSLNEMKEKIDKVEGGWKTLLWLGGFVAAASATIGGIITTYWPFSGR